MTNNRCTRLGCPNPQQGGQTEQLYGLHLCDTHYQQFRNGTIGQDFDPRKKEWPCEHIKQIITTYTDDYLDGHASCRTLAAHLNTSKDSIHHILTNKFPIVRSGTAMSIIDAHAQRVYERQHKLKPRIE